LRDPKLIAEAGEERKEEVKIAHRKDEDKILITRDDL
jgi:hypothetical protein